MPFPSTHVYLSLAGPLRTSETWSIGLRLSNNFFPTTQEAQQALLDDFAPIVTGWWDVNGVSGSAAALQTVKLNNIGPDGKYLNDWTNRVDLQTPVASGTASPYPNQVACVVTLETGATRGYAHRGRVFMPAPIGTLGTDGRLTEPAAQDIVDDMKVFLDLINGYEALGEVIVGSNVGAGRFRPVTGISVGRVLDTMRSRRTSLEEGRVAVALAAAT